MTRILICPNAFKGSLDAHEVASAISEGFKMSKLECELEMMPIADGGDGSLGIIAGYLNAKLLEMEVSGPLGALVNARFGFNEQQAIGIVEMAEASGIRLLREDELNPWKASTLGTGELIRELVKMDMKELYLTLGGSATVDGALGILLALGAECYVNDQILAQPTTADLLKMDRINLENVKNLMKGIKITILSDVTNPLLGEQGAAAVFGPQKGASGADIAKLEQALTNLSELLKLETGKDVAYLEGGGAAGGISATFHAVFNAKIVSGAEKILDWAGFEESLGKCDILVTGEGRIDQQTAAGKGPGLVAKKAKSLNKLVIGLSGSLDEKAFGYTFFDAVFPIINAPASLQSAFDNTLENLKRTSLQIGNLLATDRLIERS